MRKSLLLLAALLPLAAGQALAADSSPGIGGILKDAATQAAGQAAQDTLDRSMKGGSDRDGGRKEKASKGRDRDDDARGASYDNRRDGRGDYDNPGRGHGKGKKNKNRD